VAAVLTAHRQTEGAGFVVRRPFPVPSLEQIDPFLLLDEMGPTDYVPGKAVGAPDHPHRGFETVTYLLEGAMEHRDSTGGHGVIVPGGVQWMTAGSGVVHSEMPTEAIMRDGGRVHGFQLWVNLRAADKMIRPRYQGFGPDELSIVATAGGSTVRVVAGEVAGTKGPVESTSPVTYAHVTVAPGDSVEWAPAEGHTALVHVFGGSVSVNDVTAVDGQMVVLERLAGAVTVRSDSGAEVLLLGGQPLGEPIARYGPFVMTTRDEIVQAFADYEAGLLGSIAPLDRVG
jgi:hypothetical protein